MFALQVKDMGEDFVFEDKDEASDVWTHEQRLRQNASMYLQALSPVKIDAIAKPANWLLSSLQAMLHPLKLKVLWTLTKAMSYLPTHQTQVITTVCGKGFVVFDPAGHAKKRLCCSTGFKETTVDEVHEAMQTAATGEVLFLDVRTPREYVAGHAPDAINIELDALSEAVRAGTLVDWEEQGQIVVICGSGKRSAQAAVRLSKVFNFKDVINVKGGMQEWAAAGYEVQTGEGMTLDAPPHLL